MFTLLYEGETLTLPSREFNICSSMFLFCHLTAGLLVGLAFYAWRKDLLVFPVAALGAVLPDLVDKPLGLLLRGTMSYGRIFAHSLVFALALLVLGFLLYWRTRSPLGIALAAGVLSHQFLDALWLEPVTWFWPLLGPFPEPVPEPLLEYLLRQVTQPAEWVFAAGAAFSGLALAARVSGHRARTTASIISLGMAFFGMWAALCAVTGSFCPVTAWDDRTSNLIVAVVLLLGAMAVDRVGGMAARSAGVGLPGTGSQEGVA